MLFFWTRGVKWCVDPPHKVSNLETHQQKICHRKQIKLNGMAFFPPPPSHWTACFLCQANPLYSALAAIYSRRQGQGRPGVPVVISREKWDRWNDYDNQGYHCRLSFCSPYSIILYAFISQHISLFWGGDQWGFFDTSMTTDSLKLGYGWLWMLIFLIGTLIKSFFPDWDLYKSSPSQIVQPKRLRVKASARQHRSLLHKIHLQSSTRSIFNPHCQQRHKDNNKDINDIGRVKCHREYLWWVKLYFK